MSGFNEDQKKALKMAVGYISTLTDAGYETDEQDQNALDLLDRYALEHGADSAAMVQGGLTSLNVILLDKVAVTETTTVDVVLQRIAKEYGLDEE